jgi:imidazole glycerol-phosphate synthase subunit HisF
LSHFTELFQRTSADAALAASIFHYGELTVNQVKMELKNNSLPVRLL